MSDEKHLRDWLASEAREGEARGRRMPLPPVANSTSPRILLGARQRTTLTGVGVATVLLAVVLLNRPSGAPPADPGASDAPPPAPTPELPGAELPSAAQTLIEDTLVAFTDPRPDGTGNWVAGTLTKGWGVLPYSGYEAQVRTDWNRVIVARPVPGFTIVEEVLPGGTIQEIYRTADGLTSSTHVAARAQHPVIALAGVDLGVVLVDEGTGEVVKVVPPAESLVPVQRGELYWSPSGQTLASPLCTEETCILDIVTIEDHSMRLLQDFIPVAVSDRFAVGYRSLADRALRVVDLSTSVESKVQTEITSPRAALALPDGSFLLSGRLEGGELGFARLDPAAGAATTVYSTKEDVLLYPQWVSSQFAVLGPRAGLGDLVKHGLPLVVLDVATGKLATSALTAKPLP